LHPKESTITIGFWAIGALDLTCHEILPVFLFTQDDQAIAKPGHLVNAETPGKIRQQLSKL
jgi:hypothetical protein